MTRIDLDDECEINGLKKEELLQKKSIIKEEKTLSLCVDQTSSIVNQQFLNIDVRQTSCFIEEIESDEELDQL